MLGLPPDIAACLFDLDGVLTDTAAAHAAAWKEMFDAYLRQQAEEGGSPYVPFESHDYDEYVDGKPRADGVRDFLHSRHIDLAEGDEDDPPGALTVHGLGNRKNVLLQERIRRDGVEVFEGSLRYLDATRETSLRRAVVSSSANTAAVLEAAGITDYFEVRVDGNDVSRHGLQGKPAPDTFLEAARRLDVEPGRAAVFEDALSGVEAGHRGHFGFVVGVDRAGQAGALARHGADRVVEDLGELLDTEQGAG